MFKNKKGKITPNEINDPRHQSAVNAKAIRYKDNRDLYNRT